MMVDYPRFWDRHSLSVSHFLLWTAAAAAYLGVAASGGRGQTRVSSSTSTDITLVVFNQYTTIKHWGLLVGPNLLDERFNWDQRTKNMKTTLLTKLTSNWSPSKALTLPYEIPLGKVRWNVRDPDNKCTKAFMRLEKIHLKKGYKEIGGNCMDLVKGALNFLGKRGCVGNDVVRRYREIYKQDYARVRKAVFEGGEERE